VLAEVENDRPSANDFDRSTHAQVTSSAADRGCKRRVSSGQARLRRCRSPRARQADLRDTGTPPDCRAASRDAQRTRRAATASSYSSLEAETGLATGWKQCGSLNVARTPDRLSLLKRQMARARSFGIDFEFISPAEAGAIYPILRTDDLSGAVWIPGDGKANPTDLTQSLARGARMRGARSFCA
jgi:glycine/D-amino acid oxidase-like deaminating enzyme